MTQRDFKHAGDRKEDALTNRPLKILLAEDNLVNQKLANALLTKQGYTVHTVPDGRQAVTAALSGDFDVVLMDVQMPIVDGMEATKQIRANWGDSAPIPIIAMTAQSMAGDRDKCIDAGMNGFVAKPMKADELDEEIVRVWQSDTSNKTCGIPV